MWLSVSLMNIIQFERFDLFLDGPSRAPRGGYLRRYCHFLWSLLLGFNVAWVWYVAYISCMALLPLAPVHAIIVTICISTSISIAKMPIHAHSNLPPGAAQLMHEKAKKLTRHCLPVRLLLWLRLSRAARWRSSYTQRKCGDQQSLEVFIGSL